ncbi:hypothetical protein OpiT1DRAFT_03680 [Opitutaceae bacterium TAV1]|nr:hypothetical protein OpiT1DRAFT_03680 [Opitutaceae bacterium TAV1]
MKSHRTPCFSVIPLVAFLTIAPLVSAAVIYETGFSAADGYTVGALPTGTAGWTISLGGTSTINTFFIAGPGTQNPKIPSGLSAHPASLSDGNLFWIGARTEGATSSNTNVATLAFTDAEHRVQETFSVSFDLYVGPQSGSAGASFNFGLGQGTSVPAKAPLIRLHGAGSSGGTTSLRIRDDGTDLTGQAILDQNAWYRFVLTVNPATGSSGTYGVAVYTLDAEGTITGTAFLTPETYDYSGVNGGFDSLRFSNVSNRSDYWIDNITISTIPEPRAATLLGGVIALLCMIVLKLRCR